MTGTLREVIAQVFARADGRADFGPCGEDYTKADAILADYIIVPCKPVPQSERPVCPACGTWQCATCGYRRIGAFRFVEQTCKLPCTSTSGVFLDTRHSNYGKYLDHLEALREYTR